MGAARLAGRDRGRRILSELLLALPFGLAIGLTLGALGGGGSVLAVPVLVYVLGQKVDAAVTGSLLVVGAGALAAGLGHAGRGGVCLHHAAWITAASLPGVAAGTIAAAQVGEEALLAGFAGLMLAAAAATWRRAEDDGDRGSSRPDCPPLRLPRDLLVGAVVGFLTAFFGVGGGFLVVPALAVGLAFSIHLAVGTSLVIITATSVLGATAHLLAGDRPDGDVTAVMAVACVLGALGGAAVAARLSAAALGRGFALLLMGVAVYILLAGAP